MEDWTEPLKIHNPEKDLESLMKDELQIYNKQTEHFKHGETYKSNTIIPLRNRLQHEYGMWKVEIYRQEKDETAYNFNLLYETNYK